ncbi:DegV family protein [Clostridium oryzae]|uniref:DegV domain-containing protein n=1 Tax=Clostridium oryzae TaxID=1450648 RepID=A0A1V4IQQ8_9CLOT|nr:DegV family protein [Clostridium oryzae]OPJ62233.1 DegV domain-containing protein [Clostridium oryzae]
MAVKILTDSTSYINGALKKELDITVVSLSVKFPDESFKETEIKNEDFYDLMEEKGIPISSQPPVGEIYDAMDKIVSAGNKLLCIFISSEMSGTYSTAHLAKNMILDKNPQAEINILDSRSNCMQLGFAAVIAARAAKIGKSLQEVTEEAKLNVKRSRFLFIPHNLKYLQKGGRIGRASALIGNFLKIIPVLTVEDGVTSILTKVRTKKSAVDTMVQRMESDISDYGLGEVVVHHINCIDEAKDLAERIQNSYGIPVTIVDIGPVIGVHVGPGAIGIAYYTKNDMR